MVLTCYQGEPLPQPVAALLEAGDFGGQAGELLLLYPRETLPCRRLLLLGLGERDKISTAGMREAGARAVRKARDMQQPQFVMGLPASGLFVPGQVARALAEGMLLGAYRYLEHKSSLKPEQSRQVEQVTLLTDDTSAVGPVEQGITQGQIMARGVTRARDLVNAPGNWLTPTRMAEIAQEIGTHSGLQATVLGLEELQQQGFGGLLAVAQGSAQPPRFIILEHGQPAADRPTICLVGKGVTFDTGGISLKPGAGMEEMKTDMGGAAAVLGAMQVVGELGLSLHVVALIGAAENMPGANAYKPGDVIGTLSGKTVEVLNTDAEGRIVMADALFYAQRYQPQAVVDIATLTGAMRIALGPHAIGVIGNNQPLIDQMQRAGETSAERVWQLPLWDAYREMVKSKVADIRNTGGGREAGSITAAAFLEHFVGDMAWAHLDIAGTARSDTPGVCGVPGATGVGVMLLVQMLLDWIEARPAGM